MRRLSPFIGVMLFLVLASCQEQQIQSPDTGSESKVDIVPTTTSSVNEAAQETPSVSQSPDSSDPLQAQALEAPSNEPSYYYTNQRPDGNRLVSGRGSLPQTPYIDIPLKGIPQWIVAGSPRNGEYGNAASLWAIVLADGQTQAFVLSNGEAIEIPITPTIFGNRPPVLELANSQPELLVPPESDTSFGTPVVLDEFGSMAAITASGELQIIDSTGNSNILADIQPLPDARLLTDGEGRLLFLSNPTSRYDHGVLGDQIEAAAITLVDTQPEPKVLLTISIPEPAVVEGIAPLWADLNGDGQREIIVTQSDAEQGAQIVVYDEGGIQVAIGPAIGRGYRWRHQIAVTPFGPGGEVELVDVLTPHIGGVVEFYRLEDDQLNIVAEVPGFTSHVIGTRNLDMALAGDFDGDGATELLLPNQARTELGAIRRTADGAEVAWTVPMNGRLSTNLAAVQLANGQLAIGAGREDGILRVWQP